MGLFKSLFGGNNTPETEKEKNDKKNFEILKYDGKIGRASCRERV